MHEVITLQIGNYANWVGSHFWNFQDEIIGLSEVEGDTGHLAASINSDVLYRTGETRKGIPTYTPRLVSFDLKGSMGAVGTRGILYDAPFTASADAVQSWGGSTQVFRSESVPKNEFLAGLEEEGYDEDGGGGPGGADALDPMQGLAAGLAGVAGPPGEGAGEDAVAPEDHLARAARVLERTAEYWTDYLKCHIHPRSVFQVPGVWQGVQAFSGFGDSRDVMGGAEGAEEVTDRIRFFVEECDALQGLQLLAEDVGGFGQLSRDLAQELEDEYSGTPVAIYSVRPPRAGGEGEGADAAKAEAALCGALALGTVAPLAGLYVPLDSDALPGGGRGPLSWSRGSRFHTSALHAAFVDTATLPHRLQLHAAGGSRATASGAVDMRTLNRAMRARLPSPLAAASASVPAAASYRARSSEGVADERMGPGGGQGDARSKAHGGPEAAAAVSRTQVWTAGLGRDPGCAMAESLVLRGARVSPPPGADPPPPPPPPPPGAGDDAGGGRQVPEGCGPAVLEEAAGALDQSLLREEERAVRQRCVTLQPLPLPLPFPQLFAPTVLRYGDAAPPGWSRGESVDVASVPFLARLTSTRNFRALIETTQSKLKAHSRTVEGRRLLDGWGYGADDVAHVREGLANMAADFKGDSESEGESDDDVEDWS